jgi:signal transduction histidine kinase
MGTDITARKLLESQLMQAQKLESIGQLAAGIAHEINTPTQYVGDNTRFLQDAFGDLTTLLEQYAALFQASKAGLVPPALIREVEATAATVDVAYLTEEIPKAIQQSLEGIERIATIVRAMKEFSYPGHEDKTVIDLNKAIESTITVARNEWKYVAEMATDFDSALPLVPCLPGELNQVVLNLIVNAAHTIADVVGHGGQEKGTITIRTRQESDWVEVHIADTGMGIPTAIRDKVFDPFFTTKEVGKGTGQGLAIAHDVVVRKHGGTITFDTAEGQGTTFRIRLPLGISDV